MEDTKASLLLTRPATKVFPGLKAKFRGAIPQTLALHRELGPGVRLPLQELLGSLEDLGLHFTDLEIDYMQRRYADFKEEVCFSNIVETLDILPPKEHVDPEQFADSLPQPYRMVTKLIEQYILDVAWLDIIRRHPELEVGSDGTPFNLPRNRNLQVTCVPTHMKVDQESNVQSMFNGSGGSGGFHFVATRSGLLTVTDSVKGKPLKSLPVFPHADEKNARVVISKAITESNTSRIVLIETATTWEAPPPDPDAKPKKGAEEPEPVLTTKNILAVVDVRIPQGSDGCVRDDDIEARLVANLDVPDATTTDSFVIDLTGDGQMLVVHQACVGADVSVYQLPRLSTTGLWPKDLSKVEETKEHTFGEDGTILELSTPMCRFKAADFSGLGGEAAASAHVLDLVLFNRGQGGAAKSQRKPPPPPTPTASEGDETAAEAAAVPVVPPSPGRTLDLLGVGLAMILEGTASWAVISFRKKDIPGASEDEMVTSPIMQIDPYLVKEIVLSAPSTATATDRGRSCLVIGQADGMVSCFSLYSLLLMSVSGRHEVAVSALALVRRDRIDSDTKMLPGRGGMPLEFFLISGALDGSMCFFAICTPRLFAPDKAVRDPHTLAESDTRMGYRCLRTELMHFRHDYTCPVVTIQAFDSKALAVVQTRDGTMAMYDAEGAELLGVLVTATGMAAKMNPSRTATDDDLWTPTEPDKPSDEEGEGAAEPEAKDETKDETKDEGGGGEGEGDVIVKPMCRASKYSESTLEESRLARSGRCIVGTSASGVGIIFMRASDSGAIQPVYASFSTDDIVKTLCPGVERFTQTASWSKASPAAIFSMLTPAERRSSTVDVAGFSHAPEGSAGVHQSSSTLRPGSSAVGSTSRKGSSSRKDSRGGLKRSAPPKLTTGNLEAFEASLRPLQSVPGSMLHQHNLDVIMGPTSSVQSSMQKSKDLRLNRKNKIANRFKSIARVLSQQQTQ